MKNKKSIPTIKIPDSVLKAGILGIEIQIQKLNLTKGTKKMSVSDTCFEKLGERPIDPSSNTTYEKHFRGLR